MTARARQWTPSSAMSSAQRPLFVVPVGWVVWRNAADWERPHV
jgi:hypothetical protein